MSAELEVQVGADSVSDRAALGYWPLDKPLPILLTDNDLRLVLGISWAQFYKLKKLRRFKSLEPTEQFTSTPRYCGSLVAAFASRRSTHAGTFGAKRGAGSSVNLAHERSLREVSHAR